VTILVKKVGSSAYECVSGGMRLDAGLQLGKVTVTDIETQEEIEVHLVDGEIILLATVAKVRAETLAAAAIESAAHSAIEKP
jgi:antitoxin component of MazEF toxin-antitoxin module